MSATGRFAPSPSGDLHLGNLRTALLAWLVARSRGARFLVRVEDLDAQRCRAEYVAPQLADLRAIGLDWDGPEVWQSTRLPVYRETLARLVAQGDTYECFCTRREIREAQSAPHADQSRYPGTCRGLSSRQREEKLAQGRPPTIRLRGADAEAGWVDGVLGPQTGRVDDVVLARWDGALGYHLAVVVDDLWQQIGQVVRADDLREQTATQLFVAARLGASDQISYAHVPLVVNRAGQRLAKRDGAVTLAQLAAQGRGPEQVRAMLLGSLGGAVRGAGFDLSRLPPEPWVCPT